MLLAVFIGYALANAAPQIREAWASYRAQSEFNLGYKALAKGDEFAAIAHFEKGLSGDPRNSHIQEQLSFLHEKYKVAKTDVNINALNLKKPAVTPSFLPNESTTTAPTYASELPPISAEPFTSAQPTNTLAPSTFSNNQPPIQPYSQNTSRYKASNSDPRLWWNASPQETLEKEDPRYMDHYGTPEVPTTNTQVYALNKQGYKALREGREAEAIAAFQASIRHDPEQSLILRQLGYLHKSRGEDREATYVFQNALKLGGLDRQTEKTIEREVDYLTDRWKFNFTSTIRSNPAGTFEVATVGPSLAQTQSSFQAEYRPNLTPLLNPHRLAAFARVIGSHPDNRTSTDSRTNQAGIGIKGKPFPSQNLFLSAERLIPLGILARKDWLLRATWSHGAGYQQPPGKNSWFNWSLYADAAIIDPSDPDFFGTAKAQFGKSWQIGPDGLNTRVTPFISISSVLQEADFTTTLVEAGPGIEFNVDLPRSRIFYFPLTFDFRTEYRQKLAGNSVSDSGFLLTFGFDF
ncbi:MAG: hypothetical protein PVF65_02845 [Sphingomonadales bacterium]